MTVSSVPTTIERYKEFYRRLHQCDPRDVREIGGGWVQVNGVRMQLSEFERVTNQLQSQYRQAATKKRSVVMRLLAWLREN